jgi:NAD kinase
MIHRPELLLAGVNSDPHNSAGSLCTLHHDKSSLHAFLEKLLIGAHEPLIRSRLRCSLHDFGASSSAASDVKLPLALNEIFIASNDPSAVSSFAVSVDDGPEFACKNSGILLSTGTGSAAWLEFALLLRCFISIGIHHALKHAV